MASAPNRIGVAIAVLAMLSPACDDPKPESATPDKRTAPPTGKSPSAADKPVAASPTKVSARSGSVAATVDPPPPPGVILPNVGQPRQVFGGTAKTAYTWKAVYEADPADPSVVKAMASDAATPGWDAGDAARYLYEDQVEATGAELTRGPGATMYYRTGDLVVTANSGRQFNADDPTGFTIIVGPAGG